MADSTAGLQDLNQKFAITDPQTGQPSTYFMRYLRERGGFFTTVEKAIADLLASLTGKVDKTTQVIAGDGLTGGGALAGDVTLNVGPGTGITVAADSINLANTAVTPGAYTNANITVDQQGRITLAANGSSGGAPTTRLISTGFGLSGGGDLSADRTISLGNPALTDPNADRITFWDDSAGHLDWLVPNTGLGISGTNLNLADTAVTPGSYTSANITVDQQGRITSAANGSGGGGGSNTGINGWEQVSSTSISAGSANVDVANLSVYDEIIVEIRNVVCSASTTRVLQLSVDNGATFFSTSGNYLDLSTAGAESNNTAIGFHGTNASAARSGIIRLLPSDVTTTAKAFEQINVGGGGYFVGSTSAVNAIRVLPLSGTLTSGTVTVFGRRRGMGPWVLTATTTVAAPTAAVNFTGLVGKTDIMVYCSAVTLSASSVPVLQVSTNNGSSYFSTSGDYLAIDAVGTVANTTGASFWSTNATAARYGMVTVFGANVTGAPRMIGSFPNTSTPLRPFVADNSNDIDAIRIVSAGGGNLTGGTIYVYTR